MTPVERQLLPVITLLFSLVTVCPLAAAGPPPDQLIDAQLHPLGDRTGKDPMERPRLDVRFDSLSNPHEVVLRITHSDVVQPWLLELNGREIETLPRSYKTSRQSYVTVPAGVLTNGANTLSIVGKSFGNKILVGNFQLFRKPLRELLKLRPVSLTVTDDQSGRPVPARISIINEAGEAADIFSVSTTNTVVRTGLIYTTGNKTSCEIPEGSYEFRATRGMEWGLGLQFVTLTSESPTQVDLRIRRQVDTTGFIAADTHVHTVTYSGHGDATLDERVITLAGEGVELAVATDHNHHTDYRPYQARQALIDFFTPVTGNEVTTKNGHLNAFPMPLKGDLPDHRETNWVKLVSDMRAKGAEVVILNHPLFPDAETNPLKIFGFNRASGDRPSGPVFTFDAMEIVNSSSTSSTGRKDLAGDPLLLFADWFAVLNRGEKITGVGASDSHTADNPVGQGRTYIRSSTDEATHVDLKELCRNFLAGDTSISYGIFADVTVNGRHHMGDLVQPVDGNVDVDLRVASADWVKPRRALIFLNGVVAAQKQLSPETGKPFDQRMTFSIRTPPHDSYLVCAVFGDGITAPFWKTLAPFTAAVTNPLYVDGNNNGKFESPRATAEKILAATDGSLNVIWETIENSDDALAGQMLGLVYLRRPAAFVQQLDARVRSAAANRKLYQTFLERSPLIIVSPKPS